MYIYIYIYIYIHNLKGAGEFAEALKTHFSEEGFVAALSSPLPRSEGFLALCLRKGGLDHARPELCLTITDCLSGVFERHLGLGEMTDVRQEAGMAEFSWAAFLRLFASALRGEAGCGASVEPQLQPDQLAVSSVGLALKFQLASVALVSRLDVPVAAVAPDLTAPVVEAYLHQLRRFLSGAVAAARASAAPGVEPGGPERTPASPWRQRARGGEPAAAAGPVAGSLAASSTSLPAGAREDEDGGGGGRGGGSVYSLESESYEQT